MRTLTTLSCLLLLPLVACQDASTPAPTAATVPAAASSSGDPEFDQLKTVVPDDACARLSVEKLKTVFPTLQFEIKQKLEPRLSGYVWDSRCTYWAGVGTMEFAKETPTHVVEVFYATAANEAKAKANQATRAASAATTSGFKAESTLGEDAYSTAATGVVSLFLRRGQSNVQINVSDLNSPADVKRERAIALAGAL